jgi:hypothetical protein
LAMGYDYIMGRTGVDGQGMAPPSIFFGGRSLRCCYTDPAGKGEGPKIDHGADGQSPGCLSKLRHVGDWVEFSLRDGVLRAVDHKRRQFCWENRVSAGERWVPTVAWTGALPLPMYRLIMAP